MSVYLDASVAIPLFVADFHTPPAERWLNGEAEAPLVSGLCALEFSATVARSLRTGRVSARQASDALADFDRWRFASAVGLELTAADFDLADTLVRNFATKLAAADALHLAAAMHARATLVTFDARLADAARLVGAEVVAPS